MMHSKPLGYYIGCSNDIQERTKASSGGIGTAIIRYLLSTQDYGTSMTFVFDKNKCAFCPKLIYSFDDYNNVGSIYQDTDNISFIKNNLQNIKGGIIVTCMPCQVNAIRSILNRNSIKNFIISFCCSGQTTIEGTWCYYKFLGINKENVSNLQYRGNGWPSGIKISLDDGNEIYHDNWTEPWSTIHLSELFRPKRCLRCKLDISYTADISLADPWLKEFKNNDNIGHTLFVVNTSEAEVVLSRMRDLDLCNFQPTTYNNYYNAQRPNVEKMNRLANNRNRLNILYSLMNKQWYYSFVTKNQKRMKIHNWLRYRVICRSWRKLFSKQVFHRITGYIRYIINSKRIGSHDGRFTIGGEGIMSNPQCIHFGKHVGVGSGTFFNPVISYQGQLYNPCIIIGEGTWIGKGCTLSAINRVQIGKNVLFAGHVHITDHSHGYEEINSPIAPQQLITKGPVIIEDDCWLGFSSEILSGVHIGRHCVIAARAVVTKDVPPYSIVAGNPARVVKQYNFETKKWEKK